MRPDRAADDLVERARVAQDELLSFFLLFRGAVGIRAYADAGRGVDLGDPMRDQARPGFRVLARREDHAGVRNGDADGEQELFEVGVRNLVARAVHKGSIGRRLDARERDRVRADAELPLKVARVREQAHDLEAPVVKAE